MNKRKQERYLVEDITSSLADAHFCFSGMVEDVSRTGIRISNLPQKFDDSVGICICVIEAQGKNFKIEVEPRWTNDSGFLKEVGFKITNPPWNWTAFIRKYEPATEKDDIWGKNA